MREEVLVGGKGEEVGRLRGREGELLLRKDCERFEEGKSSGCGELLLRETPELERKELKFSKECGCFSLKEGSLSE